MDPKKPKITPHQLDAFTEPVTDIYRALEDDIFQMMVKRLKTSKDITKDTVLEWQVDKMNQIRMINKETVQALSKATGMSEKAITEAIRNTGLESINSVDYELSDVYDKLPMPSHIDKVLESFVKQTFRELDNYVNQTLITTNYGEGTVTRMYRKIVEETTGRVLAGTTTVNKAMSETVMRWSNKGIDTAFIDKGGHTWQLERYAETVIRSTVNRTYNELRMDRMEEYNVNLVLVSSLPDPREICGEIQGKVASMEEDPKGDYPSIYDYGYGTPGGIRGINCRHMFFPFVEGLNTNNQPQFDEDEMKKNRELSQKQRYHERQVRKGKRDYNIAKEGGDKETIAKARDKLLTRQAKLRDFANKHNRTRRRDREQLVKNNPHVRGKPRKDLKGNQKG